MAAPTSQPVGWPLGGIGPEGAFGFARGEDAIRESIWNILVTNPGERLMRPTFGAGLRGLIHEPNNENTRQLIARLVRQALEQWEPRIALKSVEVTADARSLSQVTVTVDYLSRASSRPGSMSLSLELGA